MTQSNQNTGKFILFEGIDGCGKTTISKKICETLNKNEIPCIWTKEPTDFETGKKIRKFLKGEIELTSSEQISIFMDDRLMSVSNTILPALQKNIHVISDRYYYSTAAYQCSKDFSPKKILDLNLEKNFPKPDLIIYLDIPIEISIKRIENRLSQNEKKDRFETNKQLEKIKNAYQEILPPDAFIVNADQYPDVIEKICLEKIYQILHK